MTKKEKHIIRNKNKPSALLWQRFQRNRLAKWSLRILYVLIFFAIFGDFIANEKPLYCKTEGRHQFPVLHQIGLDIGLFQQTADFSQRDWGNEKYGAVVFPPIPYSPLTTDLRNKYQGPFSNQKNKSWRYRHWLGTDRLGHDLLAGLIAGTRVAMLVGLVSMSIAAAIGILLGAMAGYFGDDRFRTSRAGFFINMAALFFAWFYGFQVRGYAISEGKTGLELLKGFCIFTAIMLVANALVFIVKKWPPAKKRITLPLDLFIMRLIEVMNSIPGLLLLLALVAVFAKSSIIYVMVIIGLIRWPSIARFLRAELLRIRNLGYIEAGRALGFSNLRILFRHALPNAIAPVLITIAFGMASAVLLESALSFLGIGVGEDGITWGRLLSDARHYPAAWWLAVFPGGAIFITVTLFNLIGEGLTEAMGGG